MHTPTIMIMLGVLIPVEPCLFLFVVFFYVCGIGTQHLFHLSNTGPNDGILFSHCSFDFS
jgi:hypothetical protein